MPFSRAPQAGGEAAQALDGPAHVGDVAVRRGDDEIELLARDLGVAGHGPVDERLELCGHGVEVHRCGQDDGVGGDHLVQDFGHAVLVDTLSAVVLAVLAAQAVGQASSWTRMVWTVCPASRAAREFGAQQVGNAAFFWAPGRMRMFLLMIILRFVFARLRSRIAQPAVHVIRASAGTVV
jgi:hypothetical protein